MKYLVDKEKVDAARLTAKGWGEEKPIAPNDTEEGKEKNRRVEFLVVEQDITQKKVEIDPKTGKERVVEEKKESITSDSGTPTGGEAPGTKPATPAKSGTPAKPAGSAAPAKPATPATPAKPTTTEKPTTPAKPATPATPAKDGGK